MKLTLALLLSLSPLLAQAPIRGFAPDEWRTRQELERRARAVPQPERVRAYIQRMSAEPHHAGSPASKAVAEYALALFREMGLDARLEVFEALLPYPVKRELALVAPVRHKAVLKEPRIAEDPDSGDANQLPTYNAYSGSGSVTAPLVYVNYGLPEDYEELRKLGVDVKGKIVLARYGKSWRGTKPKVAYENGAVGCLIYSDPRDDGYFQNDVYPKGPARPPRGVQRGSVMDMPLYVGDPLSPGWASEPGSRRLPPAGAATLMKIPVLPISYEDAKPLLKNLGGPVAPESWRGALPLTYHVGAGPAKVKLTVETDMMNRPVYDVVATVPGSEFPDQWVIYGNHHDAWVNGAQDPASGAAALLETARSVAELVKTGWRPKRTIIFALWDAEEFGLIGSTEWAEKHLDELSRNAVAYLNTDSNEKGVMHAGGSHTLEQFTAEVLRDNTDPETSRSVLERAREKAASASESEPKDFRLGAAGAGSDYVAFLHHAGVASLNLGFSGDNPGGIYHSIYDSFAWYSRFGDKDFVYGKALAQVMVTMVLRLADAPVLPFEFGVFARTVSEYADEIGKLAEKKSGKVDLAAIHAELKVLGERSKEFEAAYEQAVPRAPGSSREKRAALNEALFRTERALTLARGLPGREWYKHQIYAPGLYTGYSAKTLPAVREAVEAGRWDEASAQAKVVAETLRALNAQLAEAIGKLKGL